MLRRDFAKLFSCVPFLSLIGFNSKRFTIKITEENKPIYNDRLNAFSSKEFAENSLNEMVANDLSKQDQRVLQYEKKDGFVFYGLGKDSVSKTLEIIEI